MLSGDEAKRDISLSLRSSAVSPSLLSSVFTLRHLDRSKSTTAKTITIAMAKPEKNPITTNCMSVSEFEPFSVEKDLVDSMLSTAGASVVFKTTTDRVFACLVALSLLDGVAVDDTCPTRKADRNSSKIIPVIKIRVPNIK